MISPECFWLFLRSRGAPSFKLLNMSFIKVLASPTKRVALPSSSLNVVLFCGQFDVCEGNNFGAGAKYRSAGSASSPF